MGFDEGRILLDRDDAIYYTGQVIRGRLEFEQSKVKTFRGIYLEFKGFCKVHWTTSRSRRENDRTVHYTVSHDSYEEYVNVLTYLVGSKSGEHSLNPGFHVFPFEFQIPPHCPSSFDGSNGHVRYQIKATVDRAFKIDQHKKAFFTVIAPLDLNGNPYCKEGIGMEFFNSYCCWCLSAGKSEITVKVPAGGAVPGQVLPVEVACKNDSNVEIDAIRFQIKKDTVFHAECEPDTRTEHDKILEVKKGPIPGHTERNWVVELEIPEMDINNMMGCRFIDVDYKFKVKVETSGCHTDDEESRPFIMGTIPLAEFNNPIAPVENNPVSHGISTYPLSPYPNDNSPYPNPGINLPQNTPYPGAPYPNQPNQGYPNPSNTPYPNVTPYPPNSSPYPPNATPYPPNSSPYPPTTSPYPPNSTPYPPNSQPYPPNSSPYPPNSSPYPPASQQPPTSAPYGNGPNPSFTGTTLLKTGNFGFTGAPGHPEAAPLLPPAGAPYPTSPYASASAPEPSTPAPDALGTGDSSNSTAINALELREQQPPTSAPYGNGPNPSFTGTTLLKTGNFGFTGAPGHPEAAPLLPPAGAPYPTSPYASASAPEPSTPAPDALGNESNPPFNPEFKEYKDKPEVKAEVKPEVKPEVK